MDYMGVMWDEDASGVSIWVQCSVNIKCFMDHGQCVKCGCGLRAMEAPSWIGRKPTPKNLDEVINRRRKEGGPKQSAVLVQFLQGRSATHRASSTPQLLLAGQQGCHWE